MLKNSNQGDKVFYILRGISGSGKSTLAHQIGEGGLVLSTDEFWGPNYEFDLRRLREAHEWNKQRAFEAMRQGVTPLVLDNTNCSAYEARPYVEEALRCGYSIDVKEPSTPWKFDLDELVKRNTHGVGPEAIQDMLNRWDTDFSTEAILNSKAPWETEMPTTD